MVRLGLIPAALPLVRGCTNVLVTPGASADGVAMIGANDDSSKRHGLVTHFAAEDHPEGAMRDVWHFETGEFMGQIPQPKHTYNVMGHANEHGVVIAETTQGGLEALKPTNTSILDYGSLIYSTLQRSKTAREAIKTVVDLCNTHGYASTMEGFSITDGEEVWYMELISKGEFEKGIVWVALRVPDGHIVAHANQARIQKFLPCDDPDVCMAAPDAVTFAMEHGFYNGTKDNTSFSFSDIYDPMTPTGARFCDARAWYIFSQLADPEDFNASKYLKYAQGFDLKNRMPLFVKARNVTRQQVHAALSSHYEGSWLDPSKDVGAGPEGSPYRYNGLSWSLNGDNYVNERIVGTQFTAWHYVAEVKGKDVPAELRAVSWWGADDHTWAPKVPLFGSATDLDVSYDDGNCSARLACRKEHGLPGSTMEFSWDSAFWVNSAVANLLYGMKNRAAPVVIHAKKAYDEWAKAKVKEVEEEARGYMAKGDSASAVKAVTELAKEVTKEATSRWTKLWQQLMVTFADGLTATKKEDDGMCGCTKKGTEFTDEWLGKVVKDTGDHYRLPGGDCAYIDADGHCHGSNIFRKSAPSQAGIPKTEIPGVMGWLQGAELRV